MMTMSAETLANVSFRLRWSEQGIEHEDRLYAQNVNLWRDYFPANMGRELMGLEVGQERTITLVAGAHLSAYAAQKVVRLPRAAFKPPVDMTPQRGRFYPQGVLRGLPGVYPQTIIPCRILEMDAEDLTVDLNHPLAGVEAELTIVPLEIWDKSAEFGGQCQDWLCALLDGPGLKRRVPGGVDFGLDKPLTKSLGDVGAAWYSQPRKVAHVDSQAARVIADLYGRVLPPNARILDLMAGWQSHLPSGMLATGLGMNAEEMAENPALRESVVHDLNLSPTLPFADRAFDAVVCSLSVEYLTRPVEVMREVGRVLVPGGLCVMVFSHRWFPEQAAQVWTEMHEFERVALVTEYFARSGCFHSLSTLSERGWPRPMDARDRYYPLIQHSDPIHAVWGRAIGRPSA